MPAGSGGARVRSGPPPDPNALRRDRKTDAGWVTLPAEGRAGDPPAWPLTAVTAREKHWWAHLWKMPQAVQWERDGQALEVALYVRRLCEAEKRNAPVSLATLVRQLADNLGLTIPGMARLRWRIARDEVTERRSARAVEPSSDDLRGSFRVVDGTG